MNQKDFKLINELLDKMESCLNRITELNKDLQLLVK